MTENRNTAKESEQRALSEKWACDKIKEAVLNKDFCNLEFHMKDGVIHKMDYRRTEIPNKR